jgi:hypothetical protein
MTTLSARGKGAVLALIFAACAFAQQKQPAPPEFISWLPITESEKQLNNPTVEKEAGAEVLFWRVHVVDEFISRTDLQRVFYHYLRLKIFDDKGKEKAATIDLTYGDRGSIIDISGRTIKPDGTILELQKNAIYKRDLVRAGGLRRKAISFAMPGVEPGAILEYRWREVLDDNRIMYLRLQFQRDFPVEKVTYFVKPLSAEYTRYSPYLQPFNCRPSALKIENDGYTSTSVENVPAFHEEPFSPSEPNLRPWALPYYQAENAKDPDRYWDEIGKKGYQELKDALKLNDELKAAADSATSTAKNEEEKVAALIGYIQTHIRNLNSSAVTDAERESFYQKLPKERFRTSAEIFKSGLGSSYELNVVFAGMAAHAGLESRPAYVADWDDVFDHIDMAVKLGDSWKIYDAGNRLLTPGMLSWRQQGVFALLSDPKKPVFIQTPASPPGASVESRIAHLTLSRDGTLEGDVQESYTGHRALDRRLELQDESPERRQQWLTDRVTRLFPDAEVTDISVENTNDAAKPLTFRYHLSAPQYAQITGKRMFFHLLPFERGQTSPFTASERRYAIQFPYAWTETDQVSIQLPKGLVLDNPDSPGSIGFGATGGYNLKIAIGKDGELVTTRELTFGNGGTLYFDPQNYPAMRKVFAEIERRNSYTLALKESQ